jgi:RimJ/RimL family protein N-acetyltransferase
VTSKSHLLSRLPVDAGDLKLRILDRDDLDRGDDWPDYPEYYSPLNLKWRTLTDEQRDQAFCTMSSRDDSVTICADLGESQCVGIVSLHRIDWDGGVVADMGVLVRADLCDRGIGTAMMTGVVGWCFSSGIHRLSLAVCAVNPRAIRCYEKVGFAVVGEFWQDDAWWGAKSADDPMRIQAEPHLQTEGDTTRVRFYRMDAITDSLP